MPIIGLRLSLAALASALLMIGCAPKVVIATGTTIGLKATPGDGETRPPQVTLAYKRAESALVPTRGETATDKSDAFSTLASFYFSTQWFGDTELASFIATGFAAKDLQGPNSKFAETFAKETLSPATEEVLARRQALNTQLGTLTDAQAKQALALLEKPVKPGKTAAQSLQDAIHVAMSDNDLLRIESAFNRVKR